MSTSTGKSIASLQKALCILEAVSSAPRELKIVDLVQVTGYGRSSVQRLVHTLCSIGVLNRNTGTTSFSLGTRVTRYAYSFLSAHPLIEVATPFLVDLNTQMDLGCDLWIVDKMDLVSAVRVPALTGSEPMATTGMRVSTLESAAGIAVYASLPAEEQENWISAHNASLTDAASEKAKNQPDISAISKNGYYFESGETSGGLATWATPVYDYSNEVIAAISVTKHIETTDVQTIAQVGKQLAECARTLSNMRIQPHADRRQAQSAYARIPNTENTDDDPLFINAVSRGLELLNCLRPTTPALTLTEFHRLTGFSVPMTQRLTNTLTNAGYLVRDGNQKAFELSSKSLDLLYGFQSKYQLLKVVWPRLLQLRKASGLRCSFCVLDNENITHLLHIHGGSHADYRTTAFVGRSLPALSTSGGRAMLSKKSSDFLDDFIETTPIEKLTPYTTIHKDELKEAIRKASEYGFAFTDQQSIQNEVNVAVPVEWNSSEPVGAIVVSAPKPHWNYDRLVSEIVPLMKRAAQMSR